MTTILRSLVLGALLLLPLSRNAEAEPEPGAADVSFEVVLNAVGSSSRTACGQPESDGASARRDWHVAFAEVKPHPRKGWEGADNGLRCGIGLKEEALSDPEERSRGSYLVVGISTEVRRLRGALDQDVVAVEVSLVLQKLSGYSEEGRPVYTRSEERREFFFTGSRDTLVPLLIADEKERKELGIHEILLKVAMEMDGEGPARDYGVILTTSDLGEGELLLDGGSVGRISPGEETVLRNVPPGLREVRVRDAAGREAARVVRVAARRTVPVDINAGEQTRGDGLYRLTPLGRNARGYEEYSRARDGAVVVRIPAGEFPMGNRETERAPLEHTVYVPEFLMDKTGVTWGRFKRYAASTGTPLPPRDPYWGIRDDHPVVYVAWEEAKRYCEWAGGRLPTEAEREKAARGTDGRKYPWGNEEPDPERGVYRRSWGQEATAAVGTHPAGASPYGLLDMGGNVWEWCADWYDDDYFAVSPYRDPRGPATGSAHVLRGGSWDSRPTVLSASCRNWGHRGYREGDFGFRCAMKAPQ